MLEDRLARANMASAVVDEIAVDASEGRPGSTTSRGSGRTGSTPSSSARSGGALRAKPGFYPSCKFVIGGGKKTRSKYDDDLLKHLTGGAARRSTRTTEGRARVSCVRVRISINTTRIRI